MKPAIRNNKLDIFRPVSITPLVTFRIVFGLLMLGSILRFWWRGWVTSVYILPKFHFTYTGFGWVQPLGATGMHILFGILVLTSVLICLGFLYRAAIITFFISFTYVELIDVTTYLNHYYFISLVSFILIWLPANRYYSLDSHFGICEEKTAVPQWAINILKFQMGIVYIFAGLAKLNTDWLIHALPMRIWLPSKTHLPIVGSYMYETWVAYLFSWFGAAYDLFIVFFLLYKRTRPTAYIFVLLFHIATAVFFPAIGMFPYVMITCSLIFFSGNYHNKLLSFLPFYRKTGATPPAAYSVYRYNHPRILSAAIAIYIFFQVIIPLRFILYPDHLFWNEEGYRFSWRVMLMEKAGAAYFTIRDKSLSKSFEVNNAAYLTPLQEKMMSTQPDMILKYAHYLASQYKKQGVKNPEVYAEIYVTLNGKRSQLFIDSTINLAQQSFRWKHYDWVLPYEKIN